VASKNGSIANETLGTIHNGALLSNIRNDKTYTIKYAKNATMSKIENAAMGFNSCLSDIGQPNLE
jgi:hypothetical protein